MIENYSYASFNPTAKGYHTIFSCDSNVDRPVTPKINQLNTVPLERELCVCLGVFRRTDALKM